MIEQIDRLADKAAVNSGLRLGKSVEKVLRSSRHKGGWVEGSVRCIGAFHSSSVGAFHSSSVGSILTKFEISYEKVNVLTLHHTYMLFEKRHSPYIQELILRGAAFCLDAVKIQDGDYDASLLTRDLNI